MAFIFGAMLVVAGCAFGFQFGRVFGREDAAKIVLRRFGGSSVAQQVADAIRGMA